MASVGDRHRFDHLWLTSIGEQQRRSTATGATQLSEQERRELVEVRAPVGPRVASLRLLVRVPDLVLVQQGERRLRAGHNEVVLAGGEPEQLDPVVELRVGK